MLNRDKRYLFTIRSLTGGGAERVVSVLASHMADDGYDVNIIAYGKTEHDYPVNPRVKVFYMPSRAGVVGKARRIFDMYRLVEEIKPDVIIPFVGTVLYVSYIAAALKKIPLVRTIRVSPWEEASNWFEKHVMNYINRKSAAIMVQNEEQISFFSDKLKSKVFVVPNPVSETFLNKEKTAYSNDVKTIVTAGRLNKQKNHPLLIKAFSKIASENSRLKLEIFGIGEEEQRLRQLIREIGMEGRCELKGRSNDMASVLCAADLFILSSDFEGMPNALMEAMAVGVPCISSDCRTGPKSLIRHRENGMLFATGNEEALECELRWAINHAGLLDDMGKKARAEIMDQYTYKAVYSALMKMLEHI